MAVGSFAAANFAIFGVFPQFYSKKWRERDVANLPHLSFYVFGENDPKRAWDCNPKHLLKTRTLGLQSQAFFLVHLGFKVDFCLFGKKNVLNRKNAKHIKLVLSKKRLNFAAANEPTGIYIYIYIFFFFFFFISLSLSLHSHSFYLSVDDDDDDDENQPWVRLSRTHRRHPQAEKNR